MPGIRVFHPTEKSVTYTLADQKRPYRVPFECPSCHLTHVFKTYHIALDSFGFSIISTEIWEKLQHIPSQPFQLSNEVAKPPPQIIQPGGPLKIVNLPLAQEKRSGT